MDFLNNTAMIDKMRGNLTDHVNHQIKMAQSEQTAKFYDETR